MPSFFGTTHTTSRLAILLKRMIAVDELLTTQTLSTDEMVWVADLNLEQCLDLTNRLIEGNASIFIDDKVEAAFNKLFFAVSGAEHAKYAVQANDSLIAALKNFDNTQEEHLALNAIALTEPRSVGLNIASIAQFYFILSQHVSMDDTVRAPITLTIDTAKHQDTLAKWAGIRPEQPVFNSETAELPGLFEKFIHNRLLSTEWLTDNDIQRALEIYQLQDFQVHTMPFNEKNIAQALHMAREKHAEDTPQKPYTVPFIFNLGATSLQQRGIHWVRALMTIDTRSRPGKISARYTDEMRHSSLDESSIRQIILDGISHHHPPIKSFPDIPEHNIDLSVQSTGDQMDGYSCGYRAVRGILSDLLDANLMTANALQQQLLDCSDGRALRNTLSYALVYKYAIPEALRPLLPAHANLITPQNTSFYLAPPHEQVPYPFSTQLHEAHLAKQQPLRKEAVNPALISNLLPDVNTAASSNQRSPASIVFTRSSPSNTEDPNLKEWCSAKVAALAAQLSIKITAKNSALLQSLHAMHLAANAIPVQHPEHLLIQNLVTTLEINLKRIVEPCNPKSQATATFAVIDCIDEITPALGQYQSWFTLIHNFLSLLLECIPSCLGGNPIRSSLQQWGLYTADRRAASVMALTDLTNSLLPYQTEPSTAEH